MTHAAAWAFPRPFGWRSLLATLLAIALLAFTGARVDLDRLLPGSEPDLPAVTVDTNENRTGLGGLLSQLWPIQLAERWEISRLPDFDPDDLPLFAYVETVQTTSYRLDPVTLERVAEVERSRWLVEPLGYAVHVAAKLLGTLEIALWGTIIAVLLGLPLALAGAANINSSRPIRALAHGAVAALRAIPELISALFLVVAFGFGPLPGVLALGLHAAGFLGKFYADEMENADPAPQRALTAAGVGKSMVWRYAVLPQVLPQFVAYTIYIFDRNVRMGTVVGLVGAGGIGQELKGRFDMFQYAHVGTILTAILLTVLLLDQLALQLRRRLL